MAKPIILVGGASSTGKSTLARGLSNALELDHRLSTGFIREAVKSETDPSRDPILFAHTFETEDPIHQTVGQSERIHEAVLACVERARRDGISLLVEGTHLLPELYSDVECSLFVVLAAPDLEQHLRQMRGSSHDRRVISDAAASNVRRVNEHLLDEAVRRGVTILEPGSVDARLRAALALVGAPASD